MFVSAQFAELGDDAVANWLDQVTGLCESTFAGIDENAAACHDIVVDFAHDRGKAADQIQMHPRLYPHNRHMSPRVRVFVDWLGEVFAEVR
ncbi:hypothetical protein D3C87_1500870 [compost metagenome]|uniref:Uncharacterized protein n=1 Tax=Pseudomonas mucidolens TaxID=46679 RepID=A0A1H2M8K9_9PSED|nr:hypothetical protein SAMN05216202_1187 [Pseudomonas mucidolens]SQH34383.1 LysR family transcriptional regulator [Pseudomonas mucidolens]